MKKLLLIVALLALSYADTESDSLTLHNNARNAYGVPSLTWSTTLAASAQAYAETMASTGTTSHSTDRVNVGENLAWGSGSSISVTSLGNLWIAEKQYFIAGEDFPDVSTTGSWSDVAHYTQIMWELTTEVGCGIAQASSGRYNYVCHYSPQGNIDGEPVYTTTSSSSSTSTTDTTGTTTSDPTTTASTSTSTSTPSTSTTSTSTSTTSTSTSTSTPTTTSTTSTNSWPSSNTNTYTGTRTHTRAAAGAPTTTSTSASTPSTSTSTSTSSNTSTPATTTTTNTTASTPTTTTTNSTSDASSSSTYTYSTSAPDASSSSFESDSLYAHNNARNTYGVPSLVWNTSLAQTAQSYAETMASTGTTSHSTGRVNVGENLAWQSGSGTTTEVLANRWLAEKQYYIAGQDFPDVSTTGNWEAVAHYTQMMWRKTTDVGCGVSEGSSGMYYYVCHYYVQGNIDGEAVY